MFAEIRRNETLPLGTVHPTTQADQGAKLFRRLDRDGDGVLSMDEMSETLRGQRGQWDKNRDGVIDAAEYGAFFESHHRTVAAGVASGEIAIRLPKGVPGPADAPTANRKGAKAGAPPVLPAWFADYDTDGDGQVGLYEWRRKGRTIAEFMPMDRNDDGYLTAKELLAFLADPANAAAVEKLPRSGK